MQQLNIEVLSFPIEIITVMSYLVRRKIDLLLEVLLKVLLKVLEEEEEEVEVVEEVAAVPGCLELGTS